MPRNYYHDYRSVCSYHITITKGKNVPAFSSVKGSLRCHALDYSPVGMAVLSNVATISDLNRNLRLLQYVIMPDHIHLFLQVTAYLDRAIGTYISMLKIRTLQMLRDRAIWNSSVFEPDFHDRILRPWHSFDVVFTYIRQNPYRLLARKLYPEFFRRVNNVFSYKGIQWKAYGNMQLFENPFKAEVVCHRLDSDSKKRKNRAFWLYTAENGGVLVSPFVSPEEKAIRQEAETKGSKIILISNEAFGERYKPCGHNFSLCESGKLLIISPAVSLPANRKYFLLMNEIAALIARGAIVYHP